MEVDALTKKYVKSFVGTSQSFPRTIKKSLFVYTLLLPTDILGRRVTRIFQNWGLGPAQRMEIDYITYNMVVYGYDGQLPATTHAKYRVCDA